MKKTKVPDYYEYYTREEYEALKEMALKGSVVDMEMRDANWKLYGHKVVDKEAGKIQIVYPKTKE